MTNRMALAFVIRHSRTGVARVARSGYPRTDMPSVTVQQAFELAIQHHQAGRLAEAEGIYRQILAAHPEHADALHLLGVIAHQIGRNDVAVSLIQQAISLTPNIAAFHSNLGEAHREMGQLEEAI